MNYLQQIIGLESTANRLILVTTADVKNEILTYRNQHKIIDNTKIMTEHEFISSFIFNSNPQLLVYIINNNPWSSEPLSVEIAKQVERTLYIIELLKISNHPLAKYLDTVKQSIDLEPITVPSDYQVEFYLARKDDLVEALFKTEQSPLPMPVNQILEYGHYLDEVEAAVEYIIDLIANGVSIDNIHLFAPSNYNALINQVATVYKLPIATKNKLPLLAHKDGVKCLQAIAMNQDIDLSTIEPLLVEPIVSIINKYASYNDNQKYFKLIKAEFEAATITLNVTGGLEVENQLDSLFTNHVLDSDYFVLLGNYQDGLVTYYQNTNIIDDQYRQHLMTTTQKNNNQNNILYNLLNRGKNIRLSYAKKLVSSEVSIANNIMSCPIVNAKPVALSKYSSSGDQLKYARATYIDQTFNAQTEVFKVLDNYYSQNLKLNNYQQISKSYDTLKLSYTSINDFYKCSYKYYLAHILRVKNGMFDSRKVLIGNIVHYVLENIDASTIQTKEQIRDIIDNYVIDNQIQTNAIDNIYFDKFSIFLETVCTYMKQEEADSGYPTIEREVEFEMQILENVSLVGKIDKILSKIENDNLFVEIYDYKTGALTIDVKGIKYGLDMQNMIYFLLLKDYYKHEQGDEVLVGTFQHQIKQKVLYDDQELLELMKIKGFTKQKHDNVFIRSEKVINESEVESLLSEVDNKIKSAANDIVSNKFEINPKIIEGKNVSCDFCKYLGICNRTANDFMFINKE